MPTTYAILNVDDHDSSRYVRTRTLRAAGFTVNEAATGMTAIQLASEMRPHVMLLDVHLPDVNGLDICRRIKANPATAAIQVLHISATAVTEPLQAMALNSGADAYLVEPVHPDVLLGTIRALLRQWQKQDDLRAALEQLAALQHQLQMASEKHEHYHRLLQALMRYIPEGITIADAPDVTIRWVSDYGRRLTGRPPEALENIPAVGDEHSRKWGLFHPDSLRPASDDELPLTRSTRHGAVVTDEEWVLARPDGQRLYISCNSGPIRNASGEITGGIIAFRDVTERKRIHEELRKSEQRFRMATQAAHAAIWEWDVRAGIVSWSDVYAELYSRPPETASSHKWWFDQIHPEDRQRVTDSFTGALNGSAESWACEYRFQKPEGTWASIYDRALIARAEDGSALRLVGAMLDVTELKVARQQLRVLAGLLPICAACKKIRDADGSWHILEAYIHANSEAEFSHGMCPDCAREWYANDGLPADG